MQRIQRLPCVALAAVAVLSATIAQAHAPSTIDWYYNAKKSELKVIVKHPVSNPENHFIEYVEVYVGKAEKAKVRKELEKQDNKAVQIVVLKLEDIPLGSPLRVKAECSIFGAKETKFELVEKKEPEKDEKGAERGKPKTGHDHSTHDHE